MHFAEGKVLTRRHVTGRVALVGQHGAHARHDERDWRGTHDTCNSGASPQHGALDWGGHVYLTFYQKLLLRLMQIQSTND